MATAAIFNKLLVGADRYDDLPDIRAYAELVALGKPLGFGEVGPSVAIQRRVEVPE